MFQPSIFREDRIAVMHDLMRQYPFATLVYSDAGSAKADHIPFVLDAEVGDMGVLKGHLGAGNPLVRRTDSPKHVLVVFQGPQTYVTPSWYASKMEHGKVVPTWNYVVVHARGTLGIRRDTTWLLQHLIDLTVEHERDRPTPWAVSDAPEDFVTRQLRGLVGLEIQITELAGTWKVSQNKNTADRIGVEEGLRRERRRCQSVIADLVKTRAQR